MSIKKYIADMTNEEFLQNLDGYGEYNEYIHEAAKRLRLMLQPGDSGECPLCGALTWPDGKQFDYTP